METGTKVYFIPDSEEGEEPDLESSTDQTQHSTPLAKGPESRTESRVQARKDKAMPPKKSAFAGIGDGLTGDIAGTAWANVETAGTGVHIGRTLRRQGWNGETPVASVMITIEEGKIKGSRWVLRGNLKTVVIPLRRLRAKDHELKATVDFSDLSKVTFPILSNPQEGGANHSTWTDGLDWITELSPSKGEVIKDRSAIQENPFMKEVGFSLR